MNRRITFVAVVALVFALVLVYPLLRIAYLSGNPLPFWAGVVLFAIPFVVRWLTETIHKAWSRAIAAVVMTYIGASFIAFSLLVPAEFVLLIPSVSQDAVGKTILALTAILSLYALINAFRLRVKVLDCNAPPAVRGTTFAQVSDVHVGSRQPGLLQRIVDRVNELDPDYVLITGDLIDMRGIDTGDLAALLRVSAPIYYCIGNHERYVDLDPICDRLTSLGVHVLRNRSVDKPPFQIIGIDDAEARDQVERHIADLEPLEDRYRILLYHRPDGMDAAARWGVDLMLTGHTHRGQIFPFYYLVKRVFPAIHGRYRADAMTLYVSPGTGTWGPVMRLGSRCEITLIRLL